MDLYTIGLKLENNQYTSAEEFRKDINLILYNCYTYNDADSVNYYLGKALESFFDEKWNKNPIFQDKQRGKLKRKRDSNSCTDGLSIGELYFC